MRELSNLARAAFESLVETLFLGGLFVLVCLLLLGVFVGGYFIGLGILHLL